MIQENKELLLKDICGRLPYGIKFACNKNVYTIIGLDLIVTDEGDWEYAVTAKGIAPIEIGFIKPFLFPISSMTEEQMEELISKHLGYYQIFEGIGRKFFFEKGFEIYDWFNKNHFDYRCLINKGLAIDATDKNIY